MALLEELIVIQPVKKFSVLEEPEESPLYSQKLVTGPNPMPVQVHIFMPTSLT
jgi:hypothetical protein